MNTDIWYHTLVHWCGVHHMLHIVQTITYVEWVDDKLNKANIDYCCLVTLLLLIAVSPFYKSSTSPFVQVSATWRPLVLRNVDHLLSI